MHTECMQIAAEGAYQSFRASELLMNHSQGFVCFGKVGTTFFWAVDVFDVSSIDF